MKQAVLGGTGNIGSLLVKELLDRNISVKALSRTSPSRNEQLKDAEYVAVDTENTSTNELINTTRDIEVLYEPISNLLN